MDYFFIFVKHNSIRTPRKNFKLLPPYLEQVKKHFDNIYVGVTNKELYDLVESCGCKAIYRPTGDNSFGWGGMGYLIDYLAKEIGLSGDDFIYQGECTHTFIDDNDVNAIKAINDNCYTLVEVQYPYQKLLKVIGGTIVKCDSEPFEEFISNSNELVKSYVTAGLYKVKYKDVIKFHSSYIPESKPIIINNSNHKDID